MKAKLSDDKKDSIEVEATKEEITDQIYIQIRLITPDAKNISGTVSVCINDTISSINSFIKVPGMGNLGAI